MFLQSQNCVFKKCIPGLQVSTTMWHLILISSATEGQKRSSYIIRILLSLFFFVSKSIYWKKMYNIMMSVIQWYTAKSQNLVCPKMWIFIFRKIRSYKNWSGPRSKKEQWETCILNVESSSYSKFVFQQLGRIVSARLWPKATQKTMKQSSCAYISPTPACAVDFWNQMEERCACKRGSVQKTGLNIF